MSLARVHSANKKLDSGQVPHVASSVSNVLCVLGSLFLVIYGFKSYWAGMPFYAYSLFAFAALTFGSLVAYKLNGNWVWHRNVIAAGFSLLYLFLLASGGEENTGLLWCYIYPLLILSILGPLIGRWILLGVLALSAVILYLPDLVWTLHSYSDNTKYRFSGSIVFVAAMAYLMEWSRMLAEQATEKATASLQQLVRTDELTGVYNRRGIKQRIQLELHRVARDKSELSVVLCDVDLFKRINDRYGHDTGDLALKRIAEILSSTVRVTDVVGRWGGEEFLILLPNTRLEEGFQLIERVRETIAAESLELNGHVLEMSISCGICSTRFSSRFEDLIKAADVSLYEAKEQGRNCTRPVVQLAS